WSSDVCSSDLHALECKCSDRYWPQANSPGGLSSQNQTRENRRAETLLGSKGAYSLSLEKSNSHPATVSAPSAAVHQKNPTASSVPHSSNRDLLVSTVHRRVKNQADEPNVRPIESRVKAGRACPCSAVSAAEQAQRYTVTL